MPIFDLVRSGSRDCLKEHFLSSESTCSKRSLASNVNTNAFRATSVQSERRRRKSYFFSNRMYLQRTQS